jgi:LPXTG-motif cell wall-anchored protein
MILGIFNANRVYADEGKLEIDSFSGLIISEDVVNDPNDLEVEITGDYANEARINIVTREHNDQYKKEHPNIGEGSYEYDRNQIFPSYVKTSGKINIEFPYMASREKLLNTQVKVTYPQIGYMENDDLERRPIGAYLTISEIEKGPVNLEGYGHEISSIDLASNLFSGISYIGVHSTRLKFEYFYSNPDDSEYMELVNFKSHEDGYGESAMSFNSLNGHSDNGSSKGDNPEFAKEIHDRDGVLARETLVKRGDRERSWKEEPNASLKYENIYYGTHNTFTDYLGGNTFHTASVQFPLMGTSNEFLAGTLYYKQQVWFSISSAKIDAPYRHRIPIKTVQPLNQYQDGDKANQRTGSQSGFLQRYYNDLDVYQTTVGKSEVPNYYRVEGHDVDKPDELAPGVPKREERFIEKGQEFYYFINQNTVNIGSDGIILPTGYQIEDELPEGIVLTDKPFTLYNLNGDTLSLGELDRNDYENQQSFSLPLTAYQVEKINGLAAQHEYYGEDFSLRVKVKATEDVPMDKLSINQASTTFSYFGGPNQPAQEDVTQFSNHVATKLRSTKIEFDKVKQVKENDKELHEKPLPNAVFNIYEYDESQKDNKGKLLDTKTSDSKGKVKFDYDFPPGKYVLEEFHAPGQYMLHDDVVIEVDDNLEVIWPDGLDGKIVNEKRYNLWLYKVDEHGKGLKGAKFELSGGDLDEPRVETSDKDGEIIFRAGPMFKGQTYELRELEAPEGYDKVDTVYKIEMSNDGLSANLIDGEGNKSPLKVELIDDVSKHNKVSGGIKLGIVNPRTKSTLEVIKQDKDSKKAIKDVSFKVFKEGENPDKAVEYTTDKDGKFTVPDLDTKETYYIRETKAPNDYILLDQDIKLNFDENQNKWLVTEKESGEELKDVSWDKDNNQLSIIVYNTQKKILPQTGGIGRTIPLLLGGMLSISGLFYFYRRVTKLGC